MKKKCRRSAGLLAAAVLLQSAVMHPFPLSGTKELTAQAAGYDVQFIQPRVYEYHFENFVALYDEKAKQWYDTSYKLYRSDTPPVQTMQASDEEGVSLTLHFDTETAEITDPSGVVHTCTDTFRKSFFASLKDIEPEYKPTYYDKAQQREIVVPKPDSFPLSFYCTPTFRYNTPAKVVCDIWLGDYLCGYLGYSKDKRLKWYEDEPGDPADPEGGAESESTYDPESGSGYVEPFTRTGDSNTNRVIDIADAVLTCRIAAEDRSAYISDLGMALADRNADGIIDLDDVSEVLLDVARIPYEERVPKGTVPVISMQTGAQAEFETLFADVSGRDHAYVKCIEGDDYDDWHFGYASPGMPVFNDFAIHSLTLETDGMLTVDAQITGGEENKSGMSYAVVSVRVPHASLPADIQPAWSFNEMRALPVYAANVRYIPVRELPENAVAVRGFLHPATVVAPETWDALARHFGFADGEALDQKFQMENDPTLLLQNCIEGEENDVWDFAYVNGWPRQGWADPKIKDLELLPDHSLIIRTEIRLDPDPQSAQKNFIWFRITVPHGALPDNMTSYWTVEKTEKPREITPALRFVTVDPDYSTDALKKPVYCYSGLKESDGIVPEDVRLTMEEKDLSMSYQVYYDAAEAYQNGDAALRAWYLRGSELNVLAIYLRTKEAGFDNVYGITGGTFDSGVLTLTIAEYRPLPDSRVPAHYDKILIPFPAETGAFLKSVVLLKETYYDHVNRNGELEMMKDDYLNAVQDDLIIFGDAPNMLSEYEDHISVSVLDGATGKPLPGCDVVLRSNILRNLDETRSVVVSEWNTSEDTEGSRQLTVRHRQSNLDYGPNIRTWYGVYITGVPDGYVLPPKLLFNAPSVLSEYYKNPNCFDETLGYYRYTFDEENLVSNVEILVYPETAPKTIQFRFYDGTHARELDPDDLGEYTSFNLTDQNDTCYQITDDMLREGFYLPDGDYTAELCLADSDYSFTPYGCDASNWEAFQQNEPDWEPITGILHFSVKNGIADHPKVVYQMQNAPSYASP
ncbi:MAG: hypothetical protein IKI77_00860 [Oscillospiraceae bacterium]|nr:hypothetical protein [Oscillospiraceae bacterium]